MNLRTIFVAHPLFTFVLRFCRSSSHIAIVMLLAEFLILLLFILLFSVPISISVLGASIYTFASAHSWVRCNLYLSGLPPYSFCLALTSMLDPVQALVLQIVTQFVFSVHQLLHPIAEISCEDIIPTEFCLLFERHLVFICDLRHLCHVVVPLF